MARHEKVLAHRSFVFENFNTSVTEFYALMESLLNERRIPGASSTRVLLSEGGVFGAKREYLRIRRGALVFDLCCASMGDRFMVTWWLRDLPSRLWLKYLVGALFVYLGFGLLTNSLDQALVSCGSCLFLPLLAVALPWFFLRNVPGMGCLWGMFSALVKWCWSTLCLPTLYQRDTDGLFQSTVAALVEQAVAMLRDGQALRSPVPVLLIESPPSERERSE